MYARIAMVMDRVRSALLALRTDRSGVTAIEYGLIIALISILTIAWATYVGSTVSSFFTSVNNGF
jgi:pilus assembly protein Flp/PilA